MAQRHRHSVIVRLGSHRRAFTLIESMIAVVLVSMSAVSIMSLLTFSHMENDLEQERARAQQMVSEELERRKHMLYTHITSGEEVTVWDNGTPDNPADDTKGVIEVLVRDPDGNSLTAMPVPAVRVQVEVTLSWNPRGRLNNKIMRESVMTYIAP